MSDPATSQPSAPHKDALIERIIEWSARNKFMVFLLVGALTLGGVYCLRNTPLDAIPDLTDVQVIVFSQWEGRSPNLVEDQITYPIVTKLISAPNVRVVRGYSFFGYSFVYVIFKDGTDIYWARSRVLEYMQGLAGNLPPGVTPTLGPDATGCRLGLPIRAGGQKRQARFGGPALVPAMAFALLDSERRRRRRSGHHRRLREAVPGGDRSRPTARLQRSHQQGSSPPSAAPTTTSADANSNRTAPPTSCAAKATSSRWTICASWSWAPTRAARPSCCKDVARNIAFGPEMRRGAGDFNGEGETIGGIVVVRFGQNVLQVIDRIKAKLAEVKPSLPEGVEIVTTYDRSDLIHRSIQTLTRTIIEESIIVSIIVIVFLLDFGGAARAIVTLPIAVALAFIPMYFMGLTANIMSLAGIAIAIGALCDEAVVMVENVHKHLEHAPPGLSRHAEAGDHHHGVQTARQTAVLRPAGHHGQLHAGVHAGIAGRPPLQAAGLHQDLHDGVGGVSLHHHRPGADRADDRRQGHPRAQAPHQPPAAPALLPVGQHVDDAGAFCPSSSPWWRWPPPIPIYKKLGSEFMPPLNEGTILYMPTSLPTMSITEATRLMQIQDRILKQFPEVLTVHGKAGRSETATDPAPMEMFETVVQLKPEKEWRHVPNPRWYSSWAPEWTAEGPAQNLARRAPDDLGRTDHRNGRGAANPRPGQRLDHADQRRALTCSPPASARRLASRFSALTWSRSPNWASTWNPCMREVPGTRSVFAERTTGGYYLDITPNRAEIARYGLNVEDVLMQVEISIGGMAVARTIEGRERYTINVRYSRELRDDVDKLKRVLVPVDGGVDWATAGRPALPARWRAAVRQSARAGIQQIPLGQLVDIRTTSGPPVIRNENGALTGWVYVDMAGRDIGGYVTEAKKAVSREDREGRAAAHGLSLRVVRAIRAHAARARTPQAGRAASRWRSSSCCST